VAAVTDDLERRDVDVHATHRVTAARHGPRVPWGGGMAGVRVAAGVHEAWRVAVTDLGSLFQRQRMRSTGGGGGSVRTRPSAIGVVVPIHALTHVLTWTIATLARACASCFGRPSRGRSGCWGVAPARCVLGLDSSVIGRCSVALGVGCGTPCSADLIGATSGVSAYPG